MERNVQRSGLVNLAAAVVIFIAALVVATYVHSLAGQVASVFLGLGILVTFAGWFQSRLEENERLEKMEVEELARSKGESALFEHRDAEMFPARRVREQFEKFFVPGFSVLIFVIEAGGAWFLWRWIGKVVNGVAPERAMAGLSLFAIFALVLFLLGRFSVTVARLENLRLVRPGANFLLAGAYVCFFTALGIAGIEASFPKADAYVARAGCVLLGLMAAETLVTLLLEIYRPRVKGKVVRALYDSRLVGLLAQPESLFTTAAQALDYQFGFKVSETWFFQLARKSLPALFVAQLAVLLLSTCVVIIDPGEQGVLEHFGHLDKSRPVLNPGGHLVWPWPMDHVYRYRTGQIQTFDVGFTPQGPTAQTLVWSTPHAGIKEVNFLAGTKPPATVTNGMAATPSDLGASSDEINKVGAVGLIDVSLPVQFQITNVLQWAYTNATPTNLLQDLATRNLARYLAGVDLNELLSSLRLDAARQLKSQIQADANRHQLGVKILFVGLQDIHPPAASDVAATYEKVVAAGQQMIADMNNAEADAIQTNALAGAMAFSATNQAEATRFATVASAWSGAALFTNQMAAYDAAPSVYRQRAYFQMFPEATANARKYILLVTNTHNVVVFNLEDTIRADLLNLNPNPTNSP
ncbi:MAG TPA: SPFH domain-containing protein [Verrucomicrobiae bacterium]|nr:SPFH domain-containing protein [Verrucomicrobiae bacterium]